MAAPTRRPEARAAGPPARSAAGWRPRQRGRQQAGCWRGPDGAEGDALLGARSPAILLSRDSLPALSALRASTFARSSSSSCSGVTSLPSRRTFQPEPLGRTTAFGGSQPSATVRGGRADLFEPSGGPGTAPVRTSARVPPSATTWGVAVATSAGAAIRSPQRSAVCEHQLVALHPRHSTHRKTTSRTSRPPPKRHGRDAVSGTYERFEPVPACGLQRCRRS